ncbi:MAG: hypothetical protein IPJ76_06335 [Flavobacteriales bacterium]|nr:MAG: hypothetical protein IPJ76_06335 [Flavobacteriales bacterium]
MDIVSVLIGSFVSGYIFHLVVSHWPEMKRRFEKQQDVDNAIFNLLDSWGEMVQKLYQDQPRDPSIDERVFEKWSVYDNPPAYDIMMRSKRFDAHTSAMEFSLLHIDEVLVENREALDGWLADRADTVLFLQKLPAPESSSQNSQLEQRLWTLSSMHEKVMRFFNYARTMKISRFDPDYVKWKKYPDLTFQDVWDLIDRENEEWRSRMPSHLPPRSSPPKSS